MASDELKFVLNLHGVSEAPDIIRRVAKAVDQRFSRLLQNHRLKLWARASAASSSFQQISYTLWPSDVFTDTATGRMNWRDGHFHLNGTAECVFDCHIECIDQPGHLNGSASGLVDPAKHWLPLRHLLLSHEEMISEIRRSFHPILRESESPIFEVIAEFGRIAAYPEGDNPEFYYEFKGVAVEKRVYDIFSGGQDTPVIETYFLWDSPALRQNLAMRSTKTHPALNVPAQDKKSNDRKPSLGRNVEEVLREHPNLMNATNEAAQRDIERQLRAKGLITNGQSISKSTLLRAKKAVKSLK